MAGLLRGGGVKAGSLGKKQFFLNSFFQRNFPMAIKLKGGGVRL